MKIGFDAVRVTLVVASTALVATVVETDDWPRSIVRVTGTAAICGWELSSLTVIGDGAGVSRVTLIWTLVPAPVAAWEE